MGWLTSILSTDGIIKQGTTALIDGVDKSFITKEEQTEYFLKFVEASLPMNVSRRIIAASVCFVWVVGFFVGITAISFGFKVEQLIPFLQIYVVPSFTVLVSWYFWRRMEKK